MKCLDHKRRNENATLLEKKVLKRDFNCCFEPRYWAQFDICARVLRIICDHRGEIVDNVCYLLHFTVIY